MGDRAKSRKLRTEIRIMRAAPFSIGYNSAHDARGRNFMKRFIKERATPFAKKYVMPFARERGGNAVGKALQYWSKGDKKMDSIKRALGDEFKDMLMGKSKKNPKKIKKSKKSKKSKKKTIKTKASRKKRITKKHSPARDGFEQVF